MSERDSQVGVIQVEELVKGYGKNLAVNRVNVQINRGEIFGILGPNGAGKTTLMEMIVGLRLPTSGSISVYGIDPHTRRADIAQRMSIQPQRAGLFDHLTVEETLEMFASFYEAALHPSTVLDEIGLTDRRRAWVKSLSGGQRQRLLVGVALIGNTDLLFLDEPTGSLDPQARRQLWDVIQARRDAGKTVVMTTHSMEEAQALCDRIAIINRGRILALGSPHELIQEYLPEQLIVFESEKEPDADYLRSLPGVIHVTIRRENERTRVRVRTNEPDRTLRELLATTRVSLGRGFRMEQGTLEDLFLLLINEPRKGEL